MALDLHKSMFTWQTRKPPIALAWDVPSQEAWVVRGKISQVPWQQPWSPVNSWPVTWVMSLKATKNIATIPRNSHHIWHVTVDICAPLVSYCPRSSQSWCLFSMSHAEWITLVGRGKMLIGVKKLKEHRKGDARPMWTCSKLCYPKTLGFVNPSWPYHGGIFSWCGRNFLSMI